MNEVFQTLLSECVTAGYRAGRHTRMPSRYTQALWAALRKADLLSCRIHLLPVPDHFLSLGRNGCKEPQFPN